MLWRLHLQEGAFVRGTHQDTLTQTYVVRPWEHLYAAVHTQSNTETVSKEGAEEQTRATLWAHLTQSFLYSVPLSHPKELPFPYHPQLEVLDCLPYCLLAHIKATIPQQRNSEGNSCLITHTKMPSTLTCKTSLNSMVAWTIHIHLCISILCNSCPRCFLLKSPKRCATLTLSKAMKDAAIFQVTPYSGRILAGLSSPIEPGPRQRETSRQQPEQVWSRKWSGGQSMGTERPPSTRNGIPSAHDPTMTAAKGTTEHAMSVKIIS
jgi:hypothetical protein